MADAETNQTDRRTFLQAGALAATAASAASLAPGAKAQESRRRRPGRRRSPRGRWARRASTITMLDQGAVRSEGLDRILRLSYANGVRVFDTAKVYGSEPDFKKWFEQAPEVRKQIFLVTKDSPRTPGEMITMVDERLATLGTDYIDLFFIHGLGDDHSLDEAINLVKSQEFKETAEAIRKSGKAKFIGFSTHHKDRAQIIQAAAEGGIVDAIMLQYTPWLDKDSPAQQGARRLLEEGDRPDLDEADRRPVLRRRPKGEHPRGGRPPGADARREEADPLPGPAARDLDRRADQQQSASRCGTPTRSARTPTPPAASSR